MLLISTFLVIPLIILSASQNCTDDNKEFMVTFHPHLDAFWLNTDDELKNIKFKP
jgi:hypothetical protein